MKNPYEVLGIQPSASDEEVQQAYNAIIEKYDPEQHSGNPLSELAQERINEAKEAYQAIMNERQGVGTAPSQFLDIRRLINNNRITEADELLEGVPIPKRDGEWYFLKGSVHYSKGWLDEAYDNFSKAVQMNPHNAEYQAAFSQLQWQRKTGQPYTGYTQPVAPVGGVGCNVCDLCATVYCASCCANGMTSCCCPR